MVVTGATGFLGRHVVSQASKAHWSSGVTTVRAVTRRPADLGGAEVVLAGLDDVDALTEAFRGEPDQQVDVVHAAGAISIRAGLTPQLRRTNIVGTGNVIEAARRAGVRRLLYVSTTQASPVAPHGQVMSEVASFDPGLVRGGYSISKAEASRLVLEAEDLSPVVVQPSGLIGPGEYGNGFLVDVVRQVAFAGRRLAVNGATDAVDVRDVASSILQALRVAPPGRVYLLTGALVTIPDLMRMAAAATGQRSYRPSSPPTRLLEILAPLAERVVARKGTTEPLITSYSVSTMLQNQLYTHGRAHAELGHSPRPLAESIQDTVEFWRARPDRRP